MERRRAGHWWEILTRTLGGRLALLLFAVALIGLTTAAIGHFVFGAFDSFNDALWSSIAHLVDPGSIGDDDSAAERAVGLVQVIAGIIFFAGVVLTVLTEVVDRALRRLQKGDPALRRRDHLLIVGHNGSLETVAGRLTATDTEPPDLVVMLPLDQLELRDDAKRAVAAHPARATVVVADPAADGFRRVCAAAARGIVLLSPEGDPDRADLEVTDRALLLSRELAAAGSVTPVAVELRRQSNVRAFWHDAADRPRFGANFDALVNDRNVGGVLSVALAHPHFADVFLTAEDSVAAPSLLPAATLAGRTWREASAGASGQLLLGLVTLGADAPQVEYLPAPGRRVAATDRLIAAGAQDPGTADPGPPDPTAPASHELERVPPGDILLIGFSDATRALLEDLSEHGTGGGEIFLLDDDPPKDTGGASVIEATAIDEQSIDAAIGRTDPAIVWIARARGDQPAAIISGLFARRQTDAPVLVEASSGDEALRDRRASQGVTVVSTAELLAETAAISLADPVLQLVRERLLADPAVRLESFVWRGSTSVTLQRLAQDLAPDAAPIATAGGGDADLLAPGGHVLILRRRGPGHPGN